MEIPDPTGAPVCATCGPVSWMWSLRREAWVAFVPDRGQRDVYRLHRCAHAQDPATWRAVRDHDPPTPEYLAAKEALIHPERKAS